MENIMDSALLKSVIMCGVILLAACDGIFNQVEPEDEATDMKISGTLYLPDSVTPAENVLVTLRTRNTLAMHSTYDPLTEEFKIAVRTDVDGTFRIEWCPAGLYVLDAVSENGEAVRIDSVVIGENEDDRTVLSPVVLNAPGSITGTIVYDQGGSLLNVFILVFGSEQYVQAREDGGYTIDGLPYGTYELKVLSVLPEYPDAKTVRVEVTPGSTVIMDTVELEIKGIAPPANLHYSYNPVNRRVSLEWDACESGEVTGYNVYRRSFTGEDSYGKIPINSELITEATAFVDSMIQCNSTYLYAVSAVSNVSVEKKCLPCTVTTNCINYDVDSIFFSEFEMIPRTLFWGENGMLNVICDAYGRVVINEYAEDRQLISRKEIPIGQSTACNTILKDSVLYLTRSVEDSIVFGYTDDGDSLFACNVKKKIGRFCVRDTLLYALTYYDYIFNDTLRLEVYDFHGNQLYDLEEGSAVALMFRCGSDGNLYCSRMYDGEFHLKRYENDLPNSTELPSREFIFLDASEKYRLYLCLEETIFDIADTDNRLVARVNVPSILYDWNNMQWTTINDQTEFAAIGGKKVYIFTPPE